MVMRSPCLIAVLFSASLLCAQQATPGNAPLPTSDARALTLATQSMAALAGQGAVSDVTLTATVTSSTGSDAQTTGTATLKAQGVALSRLDLSLDGAPRTEIRALTGTAPNGTWVSSSSTAATPQPYAQHNCWTDPVWFFPALSALTQTASTNFVFSYVGQEVHDGLNSQHIRVFQARPNDPISSPIIQRLSTVDFYLDPVTFLPSAIAFSVHPDADMNQNIPMEVRFANYQAVNGVQVPFHVQRLLNGSMSLDIVVTTATINAGIPATAFSVQ